MRQVFDSFVEELRADPRLAGFADDCAKEFREAEIESGHNLQQHKFLRMVAWIIQQPRTLDERIEAIHKLQNLPPGPRIVSMKLLTGWQ
jgi:hypothetical protein